MERVEMSVRGGCFGRFNLFNLLSYASFPLKVIAAHLPLSFYLLIKTFALFVCLLVSVFQSGHASLFSSHPSDC